MLQNRLDRLEKSNLNKTREQEINRHQSMRLSDIPFPHEYHVIVMPKLRVDINTSEISDHSVNYNQEEIPYYGLNHN